MAILDEDGYIFGLVNVLDAFVVFLIVVAGGAGGAIVLGGELQTSPSTEEVDVAFYLNDTEPFVAEALEEGPIKAEDVVRVENVSVRPATVVVTSDDGGIHEVEHPRRKFVELRVTLNASHTESGYVFRGEELEIGRELRLDFGDVSIQPVVAEIID